MIYSMEPNKKKLIVIFCTIIILILVVLYFVVQTSQTVPPPVEIPTETKHPVRIIPPLSKEDEVLVKEAVSKKPIPLSKTDAAAMQQVVSPKNTPKPLSPQEDAAMKKILGI